MITIGYTKSICSTIRVFVLHIRVRVYGLSSSLNHKIIISLAETEWLNLL